MMAEKVCCMICRKEFSKKGIFTHYDRTHLKLTHYSSGNNGKYKEISSKLKERKADKEKVYLKNARKCKGCKKTLPFSQLKNTFCSHSCASSYHNKGRPVSQDTKKKISEHWKKCRAEKEPYKCKNCKLEIKDFNSRVYCSNMCKKEFKNRNLSEKQKYRKESSFKFNLSDYPDKFDFSLIERYGWYKAPNKGNNPDGISRDHMISIHYGWKNNIPPEIISHPANCNLVRNSVNYRKRTSCSLTLEQLMERIKNW